MKKVKLTPIAAKQKLKDHYKYFETDFYQDGEDIYMNCQDNVGISVRDLWENLELERKEGYKASELILDEVGIWKI